MAPDCHPTSEAPQDTEVYQIFEQEERGDSRGFRLSLIAAGVVHLMVLFATIPTTYSREIQEPEDKPVFIVSQIRFEKPEVQPQRPPKDLRTRQIPMPDPTPEEPEPLVTDLEPEQMPLDLDLDVVTGIPDLPPEPEPDASGPIRVGGQVSRPVRIHYVEPRYTEIARRARIQGTVVLETTIDRQGRVVDIKLLKDLPMGLGQAAVEAVRQWRFEPSTLI